MQIPQSLFDLYNQTAGDFIDSNFGRNCKVFYPSDRSPCPNCIFDTITNRSTGIYNGTGASPFTDGMICPVCNNEGYKNLEAYDIIKLRVYFERQKWIKISDNINHENVFAQVYGHMSDFPKLQQMSHILLDINDEGYSSFDCVLTGSPVPYGFEKQFFIANLEDA